METFDIIIIGAGHNGLVCAAYLLKAGYTVLLLEKRSDSDRGLGLLGFVPQPNLRLLCYN